MNPVDLVIAIALAEVGYREKASNASLDDPLANAGSGNWTRYEQSRVSTLTQRQSRFWC